MVDTYYPQWRDTNSHRRYPVEETSQAIDRLGLLELPDDWLVDAAVFSTVGTSPYCIGRVTLEASRLTVTLQDRDGLELGSGESTRSDPSPIAIYSDDGSLVATLVPGDEANHPVFRAEDGVYDFGPARADLVASVVMPLADLTGLFGLVVENKVLNGSRLLFVGEHGVQLQTESAIEQQGSGEQLTVTRMRIHAVGDPQFLVRKCDDISRRPLRFIREVVFQYGDFTHVCRPNQLGNILMLADSPAVTNSALQVRNTSSGVVLHLAGKAL